MEPELEIEHERMRAMESFLRRAAIVNHPFMLKGSLLTRQFMDLPQARLAKDLDFVLLGKHVDSDELHQYLTDWVDLVLAVQVGDGIEFDNFSPEVYWSRIDYAMDEDFPTVNTSISWQSPNKEVRIIDLDVSFNIPVEPSPVAINYMDLDGKTFEMPCCCPIALQVAWKLHQTIVRPRAKDFYDLWHLLSHPSFDSQALNDCLQALVNECAADKRDVKALNGYVNGLLEERAKLAMANPAGYYSKNWYFYPEIRIGDEKASLNGALTHLAGVPQDLPGILAKFRQALNSAGITMQRLDNLPPPTRSSRKG